MGNPPVTITSAILALCTDIGVVLGRLEGLGGPAPQPRLRRDNWIRTIHGTLAIEGNTLTIEQVTAVLDGRRVIGPARDIAEVRNAIEVYRGLARWRGTSERSLRAAHGILLRGLADDAGRWRAGDVGILHGSQVAHVAPPAHRVPDLMADLFAFLREERALHWLARAAVFHYEMEFIHPFTDGNGRMGRLWQQVLLFAHHEAFELLPIESLIRERQADYYRVLHECDQTGESTRFVELSLALILEALRELLKQIRPAAPTKESRVARALEGLGGHPFTRKDYLALHKGISSATASRDLRWAVDAGLLARTGDKATAKYHGPG